MSSHRPRWANAGIATAGVALSLTILGGVVTAQSPAAPSSPAPVASAVPVASIAPQLDVNAATAGGDRGRVHGRRHQQRGTVGARGRRVPAVRGRSRPGRGCAGSWASTASTRPSWSRSSRSSTASRTWPRAPVRLRSRAQRRPSRSTRPRKRRSPRHSRPPASPTPSGGPAKSWNIDRMKPTRPGHDCAGSWASTASTRRSWSRSSRSCRSDP